MVVVLAGYDGSHGCAAPGPACTCRCCSGVTGFPRCSLVASGSGLCPWQPALFAGVGAKGGGSLVLPLPP